MSDPAEYGRQGSFREYVRRRWATSSQDVREDFLPAYEKLLCEIVDPVLSRRALGLVLLRLHLQLRHVDYHRAHTHHLIWTVFNRVTREAWAGSVPGEPPPSVAEVRDTWRAYYHLLLPLALEPPRVDITHAAAAGVCGLPCIMAKLRWGTPYLLTEHGVYLREQYLNLGRSTPSLFGRWFLFRLLNAIVDLNYAFADQVSPVCEHNTRWEKWRDVHPERLRVIYNGADPEKFCPEARTPNLRPTVVSLGLIFPLKGQLDLIDAAALVLKEVPDVEFRLYGSASDDDYFGRCRQRVRELGLEATVVFAGSTPAPWTVLRDADVVALPSISEAFPFAVVEAMLTGAAIVATDVGGVSEALGDTGVLVPPRAPGILAEKIVMLLESPAERARLGASARTRALRSFTEDRFVTAYRDSYARLRTAAPAPAALQSTVALA
jgi:glycosyltransferase involved in cell wall biosynthesis